MSNQNESHARSRKLGTYPGSNDIELASINRNIQTNSLPQPRQHEGTESRSVPDAHRTLQPQQNEGLTLSELHYSLHSFNAVAIPVSITMILSALSVVYVTTPMVKAQTETSLNSIYVVFDVGGKDSSVGENLGLSLVNSFIIVSVIAAMTFLIVILYKFRCLIILKGWMILSSVALLGILGGLMLQTFLERYSIPCDTISFIFILFNFAIVGTISIFYGKGIPIMITQGYLILTSVILAWQLSHFNEWTAWSLLVMLALYDLCAVLTPCGPLKALVNLMSKEGAPDMPGLLYEANLPAGVSRRSRENCNVDNARKESNINADTVEPNTNIRGRVKNNRNHGQRLHETDDEKKEEEPRDASNFPLSLPSEKDSIILEQPLPNNIDDDRIGMVPLAIARIYRLRIVAPEEYKRLHRFNPGSRNSPSHPDSPRDFSSEELVSLVTVQYPESGGSILVDKENVGVNKKRKRSKKMMKIRYIVLDREGETKRVLRVNDEGRVFEEVNEIEDDSNSNIGSRNSIKLGLGDFIFYSVLVAKAVENSFTTFSICMLVILGGLGGTLILLSVYATALPALPISIFLGVAFFLITKILIEPWIEEIMLTPIYV